MKVSTHISKYVQEVYQKTSGQQPNPESKLESIYENIEQLDQLEEEDSVKNKEDTEEEFHRQFFVDSEESTKTNDNQKTKKRMNKKRYKTYVS